MSVATKQKYKCSNSPEKIALKLVLKQGINSLARKLAMANGCKVPEGYDFFNNPTSPMTQPFLERALISYRFILRIDY